MDNHIAKAGDKPAGRRIDPWPGRYLFRFPICLVAGAVLGAIAIAVPLTIAPDGGWLGVQAAFAQGKGGGGGGGGSGGDNGGGGGSGGDNGDDGSGSGDPGNSGSAGDRNDPGDDGGPGDNGDDGGPGDYGDDAGARSEIADDGVASLPWWLDGVIDGRVEADTPRGAAGGVPDTAGSAVVDKEEEAALIDSGWSVPE